MVDLLGKLCDVVNKEMTYSHWTADQKYVFTKVLKWAGEIYEQSLVSEHGYKLNTSSQTSESRLLAC